MSDRGQRSGSDPPEPPEGATQTPASLESRPRFRRRIRYLRRARRVGMALFFAFVGLLLATAIFARAYLSESRSRALVTEVYARLLQGTLEVGVFHWDSFPEQLRLQRVTLRAPRGERVIEAREIEVEIALSHLLYQEVFLRRVVIRDATVVLRPGQTDVASFALIEAVLPDGAASGREEDEGGDSAWRVKLGALRAENLDVDLELDALEVQARGLTIAKARLDLRLPGVKAHFQSVRAEVLRLRVATRAFTFEPVSVAQMEYVRDDERRFDVSGVRAAAEGVLFEGDLRLGELDLDRPWTLGGNVQATVDLGAPMLALADLLTLEGLETSPPSGELELSLTAAGTLEDPQLGLEVHAPHLAVLGLDLEDSRVEAKLAGGRLVLGTLRTSQAGATLVLGGEATLLPVPGAFSADLKVTRLPPALAVAFGAPGAWLPDRLDFRLRVNGRVAEALIDQRARYHLDLTARGLPSALPPGLPDPWTLDAKGEVGAKGIHFAPATLKVGSLEVVARGGLNVQADLRAFDLEIEVKAPHLGEVIAPYGGELFADVDGGLGALLALDGSLEAPTLSGMVRLDTLKSPWLPPVSGALPLVWDGRALAARDARLTLAGGVVHLDAGLTLLDLKRRPLATPTGSLRLEAERIDLAALGLPELEGKLQVQGSLRGSLLAPSGRVSAWVRGASAGGVPLDTAEFVVLAQGGSLRVTKLRLLPQGGGALEGRGSVDLGARTIFGLVDLKALPLALARPFLPPSLELSGTLGADLEVAGPWNDPVVGGPLALEGLSVNGRALGALRGEIGGTRGALRVDATLDGPPGTLRVRGTLIDDGAALRSTQLSTPGLSLAKLLWPDGGSAPGDTLAPKPGSGPGPKPELTQGVGDRPGAQATSSAPPTVDATIVADLRLAGRLPLPQIHGQVRAVDLRVDGVRAPGGDVVMRLSPLPGPEASPEVPGLQATLSALGVLDLNAQLRLADPVTGELRVTGDGSLRRFAIGALLPALREIDTEVVLAGLLHFDVMGERWNLTATLPTVEVELATGNLDQEAPVTVKASSEGITIEPFTLAGPGGRLEAGGTIGAQLSLQAHGEVDLSLLPPFVPAIAKASGRVQVAVRVEGTPELPDLQGEIELAGPAVLRPRSAVREVRLLEGKIVLRDQDAILQGIVGEIGSGSFSASGRITLVGARRGTHQLAVRAEGLPLRLPDLVLEVNASLHAGGILPATKVGGEVEVVRGRYLRKFELKRFNFRAQKVELDEPLATTYPFLEAVVLDLHAVSAGGLEVVANAGPFSLELLLDSDLRIRGSASDPVIEGRVRASQGELTFPAATLAVGEARIDFEPSGGSGIAPVLGLRAEGEITPPLIGSDLGQATYFVTVGLSGDPFDEMPLVLTSDPALSQLEILSLLTTGRVTPSLGAGGTSLGGGDPVLAMVGSSLAEPLTRFVTQQLERNLNLDLQLDTGLTSTGVTVSAGKEISRRLRLEGSFLRTFASESVAVGRARFLLSDRFFLEYTGESVSGDSAQEEGPSSRLELKLRLVGE